MPTLALLWLLVADLACPAVDAPRVHRHALPFSVREDEPYFLVRRDGWIVYIGWPTSQDEGPTFRMARSRDGGVHWREEDFEYDWYPDKVKLRHGKLIIDFHVEDCQGDSPARLSGPIGGKLTATTENQ